MKVSLLLLAFAVLLSGAPQQEKKQEKNPEEKTEEKKEDKKKEPFDPLADPKEELIRRTEKAAKEKKYNELKDAAVELADLSKKMSDEISAGGKEVISVKIFQNLDRAEKLVKTMREKAK